MPSGFARGWRVERRASASRPHTGNPYGQPEFTGAARCFTLGVYRIDEDAPVAAELAAWLRTLDPAFTFLLVLPFVVAIVGLFTELAERRGRSRHDERRHDR